MKILIVEDEKLLADSIRTLLQKKGFDVEVYIGFLRKKLASIGSNIRIAAIRRLGYHLEAE